MALRLIVDGHTWKSVQTDIQIEGKTVAYVTIGQFLKLNEVAYDPVQDLIYLDELEARNGEQRQLAGVNTVEVVYGERTSIRDSATASAQQKAKKIQDLTLKRNQEVQVGISKRTLADVAGKGRKQVRVRVPKKR